MNKPTTRSIRAYNVAQYRYHKAVMFGHLSRSKWLAANRARDAVDYYRSLALDIKKGSASSFPVIHSPSELAKQIFADTKLLYRMH